MSGLKDRLQRLTKSHAAPAKQEQERNKEPEASAFGLWTVLQADMHTSEYGSFVLRRRVYPSDYKHGRYKLNQLSGQAGHLSAIPVSDADRHRPLEHHEQLLFFDTETTGLGIGAGNVPFMIGIGYFERDRFIVEQMFIRDPAEELAMLYYLQERLSRHTHIVSYNGKSFDWPIVLSRYVLNRIKLDKESHTHLDFLYPSRSLWKHTMPSCRLGAVEEERLGVTRHNDVSGALAPTLYFQYLADKDPAIVQGVFTHNEWDILSLVTLAVHLTLALDGTLSRAGMSLEERFRLGLWQDKLHNRELAFETFGQMLSEQDNETVLDYVLPIAKLYKKHGQISRSVELWRTYAERRGGRATSSIEPFIELSMYYEHREKDYKQALYYAEEGLNKLWRRSTLRRSELREPYGIDEIRKRIERLKMKSVIAKQRAEKISLDQQDATVSIRKRRKTEAYDEEYAMDLLQL